MDQPFDIMMEHLHRMGAEIARHRNDFKDHGESYKAYLAAKAERRAMQTHLDSIMQLVGPETSQEVQRHLKAIQNGLATQHSHLDKLVRSVPPMARKPPNSDELAEKLFSIPELLERILLYLSPADLLRVQQVSRQFFDATEASPKLQMKMGLRPQEKCHITFPVVTCPYHLFSCAAETYPCLTSSHAQLQDNEVVIKAGFYGADKTPLPKLGKRCRNMLICQPPIKSLKVYTRCCHPSWSWRNTYDPAEILEVETGVRMGDLIDAYQRITAAHRLCPDAEPSDHDDEGFVKPRVSFETRLAAQEDDPALIERRYNDKKRKEEDDRYRTHGERMRPYIAAKQTARDNGEPIPTLAEFEKARDEATSDGVGVPISLP